MIIVAIVTACVYGQTFEVASIKAGGPPADGGRMIVGTRGGPGTPDPGMFTASNMSLEALVTRAFGLSTYQVSAPEWLKGAQFTISATVPEGTTKEQFLTMQQNLLIERFKLTFHREKKDMQVYDLVVAKGGPKLKDSHGPADSTARRSSKEDADGFPIMPPGFSGARILADGRMTWAAPEESMEHFVQFLSAQLRQPVTDSTGLTGKYAMTLRFVRESMRKADDEILGPTIFQALPEQLGLKLEAKKGAVEILVVDHIEKTPTEN